MIIYNTVRVLLPAVVHAELTWLSLLFQLSSFEDLLWRFARLSCSLRCRQRSRGVCGFLLPLHFCTACSDSQGFHTAMVPMLPHTHKGG